MTIRRSCVLAACLLAACGGGGGDGSTSGTPRKLDTAAVRTLTSATPPVETITDLNARSPGIVSRADSLIVSSAYGKTSSSQLPTFTVRSSCSGTSCVFTERTTGYSVTVNLSDLEFVTSNSQLVGTKHDITLVRAAGLHEGTNFRALGTWMQHSGFIVEDDSSTVEGVRMDARYGMAGGDLTLSRPFQSTTWQGLMIGMPATGQDRGDRLQGDATLTYSFDTSMVNATFTDIQNLDRLMPHPVPTVRFTDVRVNSWGEFKAGFTGNLIQGGFYGPGHAETAGVFEQSNIVGAFGAKKQ